MANLSPLTVDELYGPVRNALQAWHKPGRIEEDGLERLLLVRNQRAELGDGPPVVLRLTTNDLLDTSLQLLEQRDKTSAEIIIWRYLDGEIAQKVANRLELSLDQFKRRQRQAIRALAAVIIERETAARAALIEEIELTDIQEPLRGPRGAHGASGKAAGARRPANHHAYGHRRYWKDIVGGRYRPRFTALLSFREISVAPGESAQFQADGPASRP